MNIEDFRKLFTEDWFKMFKPFLESEQFENLWNELRSKISRNKIIFPSSSTLKKKCPKWKGENTIFQCFKNTDTKNLKVLFIGLSPYYTIDDGIPIADGLCFSTKTKKEPQSLTVLYNAIEDDVYKGTDYTMKRNPNLEFLSKQGVLLLNCALTCEPSMPTIHLKLWEPFMLYFFNEIINKHFSDLHIVFFGKEAQKYRKYVLENNESLFGFTNSHYIYEIEHPSYFGRIGERMQTNIFSKINQRLINNKENAIEWDEN